jgi:LacI family transcriptional regulator
MVSIKDVARAAGVSNKTVSRVVNREKYVRPDVRQRVEEAIVSLGYVPNMAARSVRTNRSGVIGVMTDVVSTTPYSVDIVRGIQDAADRTGRKVLIGNTAADPDREADCWKTFREHRIDGVLYVTMFHREVELPQKLPLPTLLVNCFSTKNSDVPFIVPDDYGGGFSAAEYAVTKRHDTIAYITLNPRIHAATLRGRAFRDALRKHGHEPREDLIVPGIVGIPYKESVVAYLEARRILASPDRPTAIVCGNDEIALQVYCAVFAEGLRIPNDVAVIGYDDFRVISEFVEPKLTTVALPYYEMGYKAGMAIDKLISERGGVQVEDRMNCPIRVRNSA